MKCPICKKSVPRSAPLIPFCSQHCKDIDLGNWATGKYLISSPMGPADLDALEEKERLLNGIDE